jgi:hypothetical protein
MASQQRDRTPDLIGDNGQEQDEEALGCFRFLRTPARRSCDRNQQITKALENAMPNRTATANGGDPIQQKAASDANAVQDGCNLVAIVGTFYRHLLALHHAGVFGDDLNNHPFALAFVSKLNSLCRMTDEREMAGLNAIDRIEKGETVEYEVIPL